MSCLKSLEYRFKDQLEAHLTKRTLKTSLKFPMSNCWARFLCKTDLKCYVVREEVRRLKGQQMNDGNLLSKTPRLVCLRKKSSR